MPAVSRLCRPANPGVHRKVAGPASFAAAVGPAAMPGNPRPASNPNSDVFPAGAVSGATRSARSDTSIGDWVAGPPFDAAESSGAGGFAGAVAPGRVGCNGSVGMACATAGRSGLGTVAAAKPSLEAASDRSVESACPSVVLCAAECFGVVVAFPDGGAASPCHAWCFPSTAVPVPAAVSGFGRGPPSAGLTWLSLPTASLVATMPASSSGNCEPPLAVSEASASVPGESREAAPLVDDGSV